VAVVTFAHDDTDSTGTAHEGQADTTTTTVPGIPRTSPIPEEVALATQRWVETGGDPNDSDTLGMMDMTCVPPGATGAVSEIYVTGELSSEAAQETPVTTRIPVPTDRLMTADDFVAACADLSSADPERAVACATASEWPTPLVALDGLSCADAATAVGEGAGARDITDEDLAAMNRMRAINIAIMAIDQPCPTADEARVHLEQIVAEENLGVEVVPAPTDPAEYNLGAGMPPVDNPDNLCYFGALNWIYSSGPLQANVYAYMPDTITRQPPP